MNDSITDGFVDENDLLHESEFEAFLNECPNEWSGAMKVVIREYMSHASSDSYIDQVVCDNLKRSIELRITSGYGLELFLDFDRLKDILVMKLYDKDEDMINYLVISETQVLESLAEEETVLGLLEGIASNDIRFLAEIFTGIEEYQDEIENREVEVVPE